MTGPRLDLLGGVSTYLSTLLAIDSDEVRYLEIGKGSRARAGLPAAAGIFADWYSFAREISKTRYDLVQINPSLQRHALLRDGVFLLISTAFRVPVLVMFHGWNPDLERLLQRRFRWMFRALYGRAAAFVVLANAFSRKLRDWGFTQPIFVETTVVDQSLIERDWNSVDEARASSATFNVLFLARIEREKGVYEAIDAFAIMRRSVPNARLRIVGNGSELQSAESYVHRIGVEGVEFLGYLAGEQKAKVLLDSHLYLFPTFHGEGMPTTVLEAMTVGLPVITRPVGGLVDFFENERMGFLTESLRADDLAAFLCRLALDRQSCSIMATFNRTFAASTFIGPKVMARLQEIRRATLASAKSR